MAEDDKIPPEDDKSDPFEDFINKDLGMESVLKDNANKPSDDKGLSLSDTHDDFEDDSDDDDNSPSVPGGSRFGRFGSSRPNTPFSSPPPNTPFGGSRFGNSGSSFGGSLGGNSGSSGTGGFNRFGAPPPSSGNNPSGNFGNPFGSYNRFSSPKPVPPLPPKTLYGRIWQRIRLWGLEEAVVILSGLILLFVVVSTMLYIDNLRLQLAVKDGQITELRHELDDLQAQLGQSESNPATSE